MQKIENKLSALVQVDLVGEAIVTAEDIANKTRRYAEVLGCNDSAIIGQVIKIVEEKLVHTMGVGQSLSDQEDKHDEGWIKRIDGESRAYWDDYKIHLLNEGFPVQQIPTLNDVTGKILGLMDDPQREGDWNRKGLVIGHVQSGKTANYTGLVSKAADAGYKFIVVIAGIHNNLRTQTQERIEEGFVGRTRANDGWSPVGVGNLNRNRQNPIILTTREADFNKKMADQLGADLGSFSCPIVLVIKKNVSTLKRLHDWLKELNTRSGMEKISDIPMLMIDDEADHASINTNKEDLDPTKTNQRIREILSLFRKKCYIGYTATPFANIFIDPETENEMLEDDLFPRDFIYALDAPTNYFGAQKVFLGDDGKVGQDNYSNVQDLHEYGSYQYIRPIRDAEGVLPFSHKNGDEIYLPESMKEATNVFLLARAIRNLRGQRKKHCSMMINASRFVDSQRQIKAQLLHHIDTVRREIKYNCMKSEKVALRNQTIVDFKESFEREYGDVSDFSWIDVQKELGTVVEDVELFLINSKSDEKLDFSSADEAGYTLTAIAIGGLSLSRGLTIEGLVTSYMYRNTKMYDTLMQMGRWFGYRDNYDDLCRIWLSDDSITWYAHIADVTEELRDRLKRMKRMGKSPKDFGLMVRDHPDTLIITAMNKMRAAERTTCLASFDGSLRETHILPKSMDKNCQNISAVVTHLEKIALTVIAPEKLNNGYIYKDVPFADVEDLLMDIRFHEDLEPERDALIAYANMISDDFPKWDIVVVSLKGNHDVDPDFGVAVQGRSVGKDNNGSIKVPDGEPGWFVGMKHSVGGSDVESIGFTGDQKRKLSDQVSKEEGNNKIKASRRDYRTARGKPLLMIHMLKLVHKYDDKGAQETIVDRIPAFGLAFPYTGKRKRVDYMINKIMANYGVADYIEEDEDYDE